MTDGGIHEAVTASAVGCHSRQDAAPTDFLLAPWERHPAAIDLNSGNTQSSYDPPLTLRFE